LIGVIRNGGKTFIRHPYPLVDKGTPTPKEITFRRRDVYPTELVRKIPII
jgi:hypothetical protein